MPDKFTVRKEQSNGHWEVFLEGVLDEDAKLQPSFQEMSGSVRINLKGVSGINSCGIREWVTLIRDLEKACVLEFVDVSVPMIQQFNMVLNAKVASPVCWGTRGWVVCCGVTSMGNARICSIFTYPSTGSIRPESGTGVATRSFRTRGRGAARRRAVCPDRRRAG